MVHTICFIHRPRVAVQHHVMLCVYRMFLGIKACYLLSCAIKQGLCACSWRAPRHGPAGGIQHRPPQNAAMCGSFKTARVAASKHRGALDSSTGLCFKVTVVVDRKVTVGSMKPQALRSGESPCFGSQQYTGHSRSEGAAEPATRIWPVVGCSPVLFGGLALTSPS